MAPDLANLTQSLQSKLASYVPNNEDVRKSLLRSAWNLVHSLESPTERLVRLLYAEPALFAATRILVDLEVFKSLASSDGSQTATQLAQTAGADVKLLERLLKLVAVESLVQETGPDEYSANDLTRTLATQEASGAVVDLTTPFKVYGILPQFLKDNNYQNPTNKDATGFKAAFNTDQHYFQWLFAPGNEYQGRAFESHMKWKTFGVRWFDVRPLIDEVFGGGVKEDEVLIVDMGGSTGHDLAVFKEAHPELSGKLIVQDLPATIEKLDQSALKTKGVEAMPHDFFTPQPIVGAKVYYFKNVLHDWPDEQCKEILSNLKPALKGGFARILLNEIVVPDTGANWWETTLDMLMLTVHSAYERRERDWKQLIQSVGGLKVRRLWNVEGAGEKVLEVELDD